MKLRFALKMLACAALLSCGAARAAIACAGVSTTSVSGIKVTGSTLDLTGNIAVTCTRLATDPTSQVIYISLDQGEPPNGRNMTRQNAADLMAYTVYRNSDFTGSWTTAAGRAPGTNPAGGLQVTVNFTSGATTIQTFNYPYYFRVANTAAINAKPVGIYDDLSILATVKLTSNTGTVQGSSLFGTTVSKPSYCWLSTPPSAMTINYTAFSASNQTGTSNFKASCTQNTTYTLSLDATSAVLLGLRYTLALSNTGTITGTGFEQSHSVTGTIAAGQAGTCTTGSCTGMQARTLTVTY